jgi:hypothetical protein
MAIRVAYYFSYRAYLVLYWPDSDFENHLQLDAGVEPVTERRALGAFINLMGKAGYAPISISRQYGILRGSNCTVKGSPPVCWELGWVAPFTTAVRRKREGH